ncbi:MAG: phosphoesterase [Planctomycetales bacterium]
MVEVQTERVLVVPTTLFHSLGYFQGFSANAEDYLEELLSPEHTTYRSRSEVEEDPSFKQLIPYCVFQHTDTENNISIFQYTRGSGQGEGRLHAKQSVGIGGHISLIDAEVAGDLHPYEEGMQRELNEEISLESPFTSKCVGLINDDETAVGRVHLGVVHLFEVERPLITPREVDIVDAHFRSIGEILDNLDGFETWSQICLKALFAPD